MAVVTYKGHTKRAINWYNQEDIYFGIGGTEPWEDESTPPAPKPDDEITDIICVKKVEQKYYVIESETEGTVVYRGRKFKILSEEEAIEQNCRWVFISTWLNYGEAPVGVSYRKIGVYTGLERKEGVPSGKFILLPDEIEDYGTLEVISNETATIRSESKRDRVAVIIEF